jgi:hypothetical protein
MQLQSVKTTLASAWVLLVIVVGLAVGVESTTGLIALVSVGLLPPLGLLLLWNDPTPTLSQAISKVLR